MRTIVRVSLSLLIIFGCFGAAFAAPTAKIVIKGASPDMVKFFPKEFNSTTTGLSNVGRGTKVWLEAASVFGTGTSSYYDTLVSVTWQIVAKPTGDTSKIVATDTANGFKGFTALFVPDTIGQYQIGLTVTSTNGTSAQTVLYVNSANFVGVGGIVGTADGGKGECAACHTDENTGWQATAHASIFSKGIDGLIYSHYNSACATCHTVGYNTDPNAVNNGFDDVALAKGWTFPTTLQVGNWDSMKVHYPDVAKLANIQCENCHGPGGNHSGNTSNSRMVVSYNSEVCGSCHGATTHHTKNYEWNTSAHAHSPGEGASFQYMNRTECAHCHTAQGFVKETFNGQPSAAPYDDVQPIGCSTCHDPHDGSKASQLRIPVADACTSCHTLRLSSYSGLHSSHQGDMLLGKSGMEFAGYQYSNSSHTNIPERCVKCHMAPSPTYGTASDTLDNKLGGHTFRVVWMNPADSTEILNSVGCRDCHGEVSMNFVEESQASIHVLLDTLKSMLPLRTTNPFNGQPKFYFDPSLTKVQSMVSFNYYFVNNDGSFGVHNHKYAEELLVSSIEQLKLAAGASTIVSVADVPNDQGKKVQVVWNQFPAEKSGVNPVVSYAVWRLDPILGTASSSANQVPQGKSLTQVLASATPGAQYTLGGNTFTFVGSAPAAKLPTYSLIVPTLYDSTKTAGLKISVFYVSGLTNDPNTVYSTLPDTGYSVDNLAPVQPTGLAATLASPKVNLTWNKPVDTDVDYFAVYRATTANFTPTGSPLAKVKGTAYTDADVQNGVHYYYKIAALDFSGNQSPYSAEANVIVTSVAELGGVPTEYALDQNHPNPFNPSTEISFSLPKQSFVRIAIYTMTGEVVATLVNETMSAGNYSIPWNGRNQAGQAVSSGVYLYRIQAGDFVAVKKMLMVK
ncbi:MAG: T9SS type A sorting domain-containing protein [Bacteroidota bacterium]|nr:T9SS type A sorting domain-containing protein [Bacteroidota bacterium]